MAPTRRWPITYRSIEAVSAISDALIFLFSSVVTGTAYNVLMLDRRGVMATFVGLGLLVTALFLSLCRAGGLYQPTALLNFQLQSKKVAVFWSGIFLFLCGLAFAMKVGSSFSRGAVACFAVTGFLGLQGSRLFWRHLIKAAVAGDRLRRHNVVLLGDEGRLRTTRVRGMLEGHGFSIDRQFSWSDAKFVKIKDRDAVIASAIAYARISDAEEIVVAADAEIWEDILGQLRTLPVPVRLVPDPHIAELIARPSTRIGPCTTIELQRAPLSLKERMLKRALDVICSAIGIVVLSPLFVVVGLAIKLDSSGPIIFRQTRKGFNGKTFKILKFRTMNVVEDGSKITQATRHDRRVTGVGRWLRRTSVDELPQLFNVLVGEMSIVGPRPHAAAHDTYYGNLISDYAFRHHVKPGITGWAQVNGHRGETPDLNSMERRVDHDIWYVGNFSISLDMLIIARTAVALARTRNVY